MKHLLNGLAIVTLMAVAAPVVAQEAAARAPRAERAMATVTEAQFIERQMAGLRAADTNGDGQVTAQERRAHAQARRAEQLSARFARLDANGDGQISREEFTTGNDRRAPEHMGHRRAGAENRTVDLAAREQRVREQFARLDADRDGQVTAQERRAAAEASRKARGEQRRMRNERQASPSPAVSE